VDKPDGPRRFPAAAEAQACSRIKEALLVMRDALAADAKLKVLASAAPGADVLVHEVCKELGIECRLCLPMSVNELSTRVFSAADQWRARFLAIVDHNRGAGTLQLTEGFDLPRRLQGRKDIDPWERGNRWMMHLARSCGAKKVTLLALWDMQDDPRTGGTAHMVRLAKSHGEILLEEIDSRQFFA